jgi:hypothetical protein
MKKSIIIAIIAALANTACDENIFTTPPPEHALAAVDNSLSITPDCAGLTSAIRAVSRDAGFIEGSTVSLLVIGRSALRAEATRGFERKLPIPSDAILGRNDAEIEKAQAAIFAGFETACASAPPSRSSPILRLLQDGVADLHAKGCGPKSHCRLEAQSDLHEDVDRTFHAAITRLARNPKTDLPSSLVGAIDNAGIDVHICGGAAQAVSGGPEPSQVALHRLWMKAFTHPTVSFKPFCGE